jgi:hypothetical protein
MSDIATVKATGIMLLSVHLYLLNAKKQTSCFLSKNIEIKIFLYKYLFLASTVVYY